LLVYYKDVFFCDELLQDMLGAVNLSVCHPLIVHTCKQVEPVFYMVKVAARFPAWKIVIKPLRPVLDVLHRPFNQAFLKR
jgi:hypothetical protein